MQQNDKYAFFDFCETLADFQTADAYVDFVRQQRGSCRMRLLNLLLRAMNKTRISKVLTILTRHRYSIGKSMKLWQLHGIDHATLDSLAGRYYRERVRPHLIPRIVGELRTLKNDGYTVGLVSGGYGIYLKYFVEEYGLDFCLSSNIAFSGGRCLGKMEGADCMGQDKVRLLNEMFPVLPSNSVAFSDSRSDLPLLCWAGRGVVVSHGSHQRWLDEIGETKLQEIIWE